jgi:hypothetical protein
MRNKIAGFSSLALIAFVALTTAAYATPSNAAQIETMATEAFAEATPIVLAVAGAAVALAVVLFGSRLVLRAIKGGGRV